MKKLLLSLALLPFMASAQQYVKTDIADMQTGDVVVIVDQTSSLAMANDGGTTTKGKAVGVTLSADKGTISFASEAVAATGEFTIEVEGKNYKFNAGGKNYLYVTASNNGVSVGTGTENVFTWTNGFLKGTDSGSKDRYLGVYSNSNWRCYTSVNANIQGTVTALYKKVVEEKNVATPTFDVPSGEVEAGTKVAISCATAGAAIYYTLDGSAPSAESTLYTEPIVINESTTIKAIAIAGAEASNVATADYKVVRTLTNLADVVTLADGEQFNYGGQLTVTYVNGANIYVYDGKDQTLLFAYDNGLAKGDVLAAGWKGTVSFYYGLFEVKPTGLAKAEGAEAVYPEAIEINADNFAETFTLANMNNLVVVKNAQVPAIPDRKSYTATVGESDFAIYNNFSLTAEAGNYDVVGYMAYNVRNNVGTLQLYPIAFNEVKAEPWTLNAEVENNYGIIDVRLLTGNATIAEGDAMITFDLEGATEWSTRDLIAENEDPFDRTSPIASYSFSPELVAYGEYTMTVPAGFFVDANGVGNAEYTTTVEYVKPAVWVTFPENGLCLMSGEDMSILGTLTQTEETVFDTDLQIGENGQEVYFFLAQNGELADIDTQVYGAIDVMDTPAVSGQAIALNDFAHTNYPFFVKGGYYNVKVEWNSPDPVVTFTKKEKPVADPMLIPDQLYLMGWNATELTRDGKVFTAKNVSVTSLKEKLYFNADGEESNYQYGFAQADVTVACGELYELVSKGETFVMAPGKYDVTVEWFGTEPVVKFTQAAVPAQNITLYWDNSANWKAPLFVYMTDTAYEEIKPLGELTEEGYYVFEVPADALSAYFYDALGSDDDYFIDLDENYEAKAPVANGVYAADGYKGIYENAVATEVTIYFDNTTAQWTAPYVMYADADGNYEEIDMEPVASGKAAVRAMAPVHVSNLYKAVLPAKTSFFQFGDRDTMDDSYAHEEAPIHNMIYNHEDAQMEYNNDNVTAIEGINADSNAAARYFNLQGVEVKNPAAGQVYIRLQNGKATKIVK